MAEGPRISVVMSAFNSGAKVRESIESVLNQSLGDFEFLILDDASADDTPAIIGEYARADARIRLYSTPINLGLTRNLIRGVENARGRYIARIDAGDCWMPRKLELQHAFLEAHPDHVLCACQTDYVMAGERIGSSSFATEDSELRARLFTRKAMLSHPTILFRNVLNYRAAFRYSQDLDLYARAAFLGKLHCLPEPLVLCEVGNDGITVNGKFLQRQYQNHAYRLFLQRFRSGTDELDLHGRELPVRVSAWEKRLCAAAVTFFRLFMRHKLRKSPPPVWLFYFACSLSLYPPFLKDYLTRYFLTRRYRRDPWKGFVAPDFPAHAAGRS